MPDLRSLERTASKRVRAHRSNQSMMRRLLALVLLCCCGAAPVTPLPAPPQDPLCAALKSNLGRSIVMQKRVSDDITKLVATLSKYSEAQIDGETGTAYTTGFTALQDSGHVNDDLASFEKALKATAPITGPDGAKIEKDLQVVAQAQSEVAKNAGDLLQEWNRHVQLDANAPGNTGMGSKGANPFSGLGGGGGGQSSGIAVMEVRPLLVSTLKTMDRAAAALDDMHPAVVRAVAACFSRVRRQSSG